MAFDLLREHPNADKGDRIYALVEHRLVHVTRLVEGLIDVARAAAGQLQISPETVDIAAIAHQALDDCRPIIETRKLSARLDAGGGITPLVMGDPVRLLQALTTLIDRAARSTPESGQIIVTSHVAGGDVVVSVTDTGRGIAPELLPRIFDMFGGDGASHDGGGLSVGLALVKRLVELHDGAIRVASEGLGKGARFEVRLPLAPQDVELSPLESLAPHDQDVDPPALDGFAPHPADLLSTDLFTQPTMRMTALDLVPDAGLDDTL